MPSVPQTMAVGTRCGSDVAEQDAAVPGAERALGHDEVALHQRRASRCR